MLQIHKQNKTNKNRKEVVAKQGSYLIGCSLKVCVLSRVKLFATPQTVVCQAPLSMEFSRQEYLEWVIISFSRGSS